MIGIDRTAGGRSLMEMARRAGEEVRRGRQLIIFPGGHANRRSMRRRDYKTGVAQIYVDCGVTCLPVALNSGLFWPRRTFMRYPGTLVVEFLDPLPPGLSRREFIARVSTVIEEATNRLVEAARREQAQLFGRVPRSGTVSDDATVGVTAIRGAMTSLPAIADWVRQCSGRVVVQHRRKLMQLRVAKTFRLDRLHGGQHIVAVGAGLAVPLLDMTELFRQRQPPGILHMAAVDHIGQRADALARLVLKPDRAHHLAIDRGDLFARAQICDGRGALLVRDPKRDAAAGAAAVEPEHQAGLFRRSAMDEGIDAERAVLADQPRRNLLDELEARPPHQRAVAEHPEVAFGQFRFGQDISLASRARLSEEASAKRNSRPPRAATTAVNLINVSACIA